MDSLLLTSLALADLWRYAWPALVVAALALIIFEVRMLLRWVESELGSVRDRRRAGRDGAGAVAVLQAARRFAAPPEPGRARTQIPSPTVEALRPGSAVGRALAARAAGAAAAGLPRIESGRSPIGRESSARSVESQSMLELLAAALLILVVITSFRSLRKAPRRQG